MNAPWHRRNVMPMNPTLDERIAWHREHRRHCACREIPAKLLALMRKRAPARKSPGRRAPRRARPARGV